MYLITVVAVIKKRYLMSFDIIHIIQKLLINVESACYNLT